MGGLMDYKARFYSPYLNHFTQPDSIVPDPSNPQSWNRYSYALNNPIRYNDPTGHCPICLVAILAKSFTANGPSGNWKEAAITLNQAFWMVHSATIYATNTKVSADGTVSTTWHIHDKFDFIPGPDHTDEYNKWASRVHHIYNDILGAKESYPTDAKWHQTILPENVIHSH